MLKPHAPPDMFRPPAYYAQAIGATSANRILLSSGTMGLEPNGESAADFEGQCEQLWKNIQATLRPAAMAFSNLAKLTAWLTRGGDRQVAALIRQRYLGEPKVATSVIQVGLVDPAWPIEVEAIAAA